MIAEAEVMRSSFREALGNILRFMDAIANTDPQAPQNFRAVWERIGSPSTVSETSNAIQRIMSVANSHVVAILARIDSEYRKYLHTQILDLSEKSKGEMPEVGQAAIMLQWLMGTLLPDLHAAGLPEDSVLGTTATLKKNYGAITETCAIARPDSSNPTCHALNMQAKQAFDKLKDMERGIAEAQALALQHQKRLEELGFAVVAEAAADAAVAKRIAKRETGKQISTLKALSITGFVLFAVLLIVLIVVVVMQAVKKSKATGVAPAPNAVLPPAAPVAAPMPYGFGGIGSGGGSSYVGRSSYLGGASSMPSFDLSREWT
jgi:hypothetical protein